MSDYGWGADIRMSFVFRLVPGQERNVCFIPILGKSGHRPHHSVQLTSTPKRRIYRAAASKYQPCQRIDFSFDRHHAFDLPVHRLSASRFACGFGYGVEPFSDLLIALWTAQYHCKPQGPSNVHRGQLYRREYFWQIVIKGAQGFSISGAEGETNEKISR